MGTRVGDYNADRAFSDRYDMQVKAILERYGGAILSRTADHHEDTAQATDYVIWRAQRGAFAARIRKPGIEYRDLTIRSKRLNRYGREVETEHAKLQRADGPIGYLYAWTDNAGSICEWIMVDLVVLRRSGVMADCRQRHERANDDGLTWWYPIAIARLQQCGALLEHWRRPAPGANEHRARIVREYADEIRRCRHWLADEAMASDS